MLILETEERTKPTTLEAFLLGEALSQVSWIVMGAYFGINEAYIDLFSHMQADERWIIPAAIFLITAAAGWTIEAKTLKEKGFTVNPIANATYGKTNKVIPAMAAGSVYGWVSNPANLVLLGNFIAGRDMSIATLAHLSAIFSLGIVYTGINALILKGKTEEIVRGLHWLNNQTRGKIKAAQSALIRGIDISGI